MTEAEAQQIKELPLSIPPEMAACIGLNETIIMNMLLCWTQGEVQWEPCSLRAWETLLPFWSRRTIRRTLKSLEDQGLIKTWRESGGITHYAPNRKALNRAMSECNEA